MTRQPDFIADEVDDNESMLIHDIARLSKKNFDRRVRSFGLTRSQWMAVGTLRRYPGISQVDLAEKLDIEPITAARTIDRLERSGWITRKADAHDRRVNRLFLTERAKEVAVRMRALALQMRGEAMSGLNVGEHDELLRLLKIVKHNLCEINKAGQC